MTRSTKTESFEDPDIQGEYDFSQAIRGKYRDRQSSSESIVRIHSETGNREVQIKTVEVSAIVTESGQLTVQLPPDITPGEHRIVLLIEEPASTGKHQN